MSNFDYRFHGMLDFMITWMWNLNLIHFFDFYLAVAFLLSTTLRVSQYRTIIALVRSVPGRWPRLFDLVKQHHTIFLTWTTVLPGVLAFNLCVIHMLACRLVWPQAVLTVADVTGRWLPMTAVVALGAAMLAVDIYGTFNFGEVDRALMQKYFDQAEFWLRSWTAPVVRLFTLGYVNPRKMVAVEVQKALLQASQLVNSTFWWVSCQTGLRVVFGLALWLSYAWK
jgi:hypothetical protein